MHAFHATTIREIDLVHVMLRRVPSRPLAAMRHSPRPLAFPIERMDERLVVVLDKRGRLAALGFPHGESVVLFERQPENMLVVHTIPQGIFDANLWWFVNMLTTMNDNDSWDPKRHLSVSKLLAQLADGNGGVVAGPRPAEPSGAL
jgi:hypothetical protein